MMPSQYCCRAIGCRELALIDAPFCERHARVLPALLREGALREAPLVAAVLVRWPGATIVDVRGASVPLAPPCRPPTHGGAGE